MTSNILSSSQLQLVIQKILGNNITQTIAQQRNILGTNKDRKLIFKLLLLFSSKTCRCNIKVSKICNTKHVTLCSTTIKYNAATRTSQNVEIYNL